MKVVIPNSKDVHYVVLDLRDEKSTNDYTKRTQPIFDESIYKRTINDDGPFAKYKEGTIMSLNYNNCSDYLHNYVFCVPKWEFLTLFQLKNFNPDEVDYPETIIDNFREKLDRIYFFHKIAEEYKAFNDEIKNKRLNIDFLKINEDPRIGIYLQKRLIFKAIKKKNIHFFIMKDEKVLKDKFGDIVKIKTVPLNKKINKFEFVNELGEKHHISPQKVIEIELEKSEFTK